MNNNLDKSKNQKRKSHYYNNGTKCIKVFEGDEVPEGFVKGALRDYTAWNKGKTTDTDERVKLNVIKCHQTRQIRNNYSAWNKGLKASADERVRTNIESALKTMEERYGIINPGQLPHEAWNKGLTKETSESVEKISNSNKGKVAWNRGIKIGSFWTIESAEKRYQTQLRNGTLGKNKFTQAEISYYEYLRTLYNEEDIIPQYLDKERYPFRCDFYIKSEDLFIEVHGTWTHGKHPFDGNNPEDIEKLNIWKEKAKTSKYYRNAINQWTNLDVRKLKTFQENNLNYLIIYP